MVSGLRLADFGFLSVVFALYDLKRPEIGLFSWFFSKFL